MGNTDPHPDGHPSAVARWLMRRARPVAWAVGWFAAVVTSSWAFYYRSGREARPYWDRPTA